MPSQATRLAWLDLFRGACVVGMIETHVLNTFLAAPLRETAWFAWFTYFDGLIAPAFLFIAGYVQGLAMRSASTIPRAFGRKLRRLGSVWLLGYALHFPAPQLLAGEWSEALRLGTQVDVLPCLAVSLALLLAIERWMPRWVDLAAVALLLVAVFAAEPATRWQFTPEFLRAYFNHSTGSLFPLLPWTGFVCAGFLASRFPRRPDSDSGAPHSLNAGLTAVLGFALAFIVLPSVLSGSAAFFFQILAWLLLAVPVVQWIAGRWQPRWLLIIGVESLAFYAAHLLIIEALAVTVLPRAAFGVGACGVIFAAVLAATAACALGWRRLRPLHAP